MGGLGYRQGVGSKRSEAPPQRTNLIVAHFNIVGRWCFHQQWRLLLSGAIAIIVVLAVWPAANIRAAQSPSGALRGTITTANPQGQPLVIGGVSLKLTGTAPGTKPLSTFSDEHGSYQFVDLPPGAYTLEATLQGFKTVTRPVMIGPAATVVENIRLELEEQHEEVEVHETAPTIGQQSAAPPATLTAPQFVALPVPQQQFKNALPLVPGVIRTPEGKLSFKGQVENQGMLLVDSAQTVDPVTGSFAINIPIDAIQTMNVYKAPYDSEYGGFSGGLVSIETKPPSSQWHYSLMDFIPGVRGKAGHIVGISDDTPRLVFGGPLIKDKLNFSEDFLYEVNNMPVRGLAWPHNETKIQGFDSYSIFQAILSPRHLLTVKVNVFPRRKQFADINALVPQTASSDYGQRGSSVGGTDSYQFASGGLLTTLFQYTRFSSYAHGQGSAEMLITPDGWGGNFFNSWTRSANEEEILPVFEVPQKQWHGHHDIKIGADFFRRSYAGTSHSRPVQLLREDGTLAERIDFLGGGLLGGGDTEAAEFVEDHWMLNNRLALDMGSRLVSQSAGRLAAFAPRLGLVYSPGEDGKTVIRAGGGLFYDRVPLLATGFSKNPTRTISLFDPSGAPTGTPIVLSNAYLQPENGHLAVSRGSGFGTSPRNFTWNFEVDRQLTSRLALRVSYLYSVTGHQFVVNPLEAPLQGGPFLALSPNGGSHYHQFEATVHFKPNEFDVLNVSYVRSSARGDLNTLAEVLVPFEEPIVRPDFTANLNSDVPNRLVGWGVFRLPWWGLTFSPVVTVQSGFPYSEVDALQNYVGTPNSQRFPTYFSFDWKLYKEFRLHVPFFKKMNQHKFRVGIYYTNFTNHLDPLAVFNNVTSPYFGHFVGFQHRLAGMVIDVVD